MSALSLFCFCSNLMKYASISATLLFPMRRSFFPLRFCLILFFICFNSSKVLKRIFVFCLFVIFVRLRFSSIFLISFTLLWQVSKSNDELFFFFTLYLLREILVEKNLLQNEINPNLASDVYRLCR